MKIPASRATVCDILRYDRYVPSFAHDRICDVSPLIAARDQAKDRLGRISWPAIWMKAYALNAKRFPRLQQTWMNWPTAHLYEHPAHIGTLVVKREFENDQWLFWAQIRELDTKPLTQVQSEIDRFQTEPVESIYRRQLWLARKPALFRRLAWWLTFQVSGKKKCKRLGTFFLSTISGYGAEIQNPPSMLTTGFTYGPIDENGKTRVTITYDHRLMDGHHVAEVLAGLEKTLNSELLSELQRTSAVREAA